MGGILILGVVLFNPPLLSVFDRGAEVTVFGIPLLIMYLFSAWALVIFLVYLASKRGPGSEG